MRIGVISDISQAWGGSEELWAAMARSAIRAGDHVSVCLLRPFPDRPPCWELSRKGVRFFHTRTNESLFERTSARLARLSYRLERSLRARQLPLSQFFTQPYDVILISVGANAPPDEIIDAVTRAGVPYVVVCHNYMGGSFATDRRKRIIRFLSGARKLLFVARATWKDTERQLASPFPRAQIVRNPVNLESVEVVPWPAGDVPQFAAIANLRVYWKSQDCLLQALTDPCWAQRDWRLSIYGSGPDAEYLQDLCAYFGLSRRVTFRGHCDNIRELWQRHHLLVQPSRIESAPLTIVEAMLCGRPVVATAVGGVPEWVTDGRTGFIAAAPAAGPLHTALDQAWREQSKWQSMGELAHQDALKRYDQHPGESMLAILAAATESWEYL